MHHLYREQRKNVMYTALSAIRCFMCRPGRSFPAAAASLWKCRNSLPLQGRLFDSLSKKSFLTGWQRPRKPQRQTKRNRRRTGGTVGCVLCSKPKGLAQQALLPHIRQKSRFLTPSPPGEGFGKCAYYGFSHFGGLGVFRHSEPPLAGEAI